MIALLNNKTADWSMVKIMTLTLIQGEDGKGDSDTDPKERIQEVSL